MAYVTTDFVRAVTGLTEAEVDDERLEQLINMAEAIVDFETGRCWKPGDEGFKLAQLATAKLAGWLAYRSLVGAGNKARSHHQEAVELLGRLTRRGTLLRG